MNKIHVLLDYSLTHNQDYNLASFTTQVVYVNSVHKWITHSRIVGPRNLIEKLISIASMPDQKTIKHFAFHLSNFKDEFRS